MLDLSVKSIATVMAIAVAALVVAGVADSATRPDDRTMRGPGGAGTATRSAYADEQAPQANANRRVRPTFLMHL